MKFFAFSILLSLFFSSCKEDSMNPVVLTRIEVSSPFNTYSLETTKSVKMIARGYDQNSNQITFTQFSWSSSNEDIATVNNNGLVTLISAGKVTISASSEGLTGLLELEILPIPTLEEFIESEVSLNSIPALSAAMIKGDEIVWTKSFGIHQKSTNSIASESTLYVTSSIAKLVVAVAVMQQSEQGKIDLDEDISEYLGYTMLNVNFPDIKITSRLLLTHQAALANPSPSESPEINAIYTPDSVFSMSSWVYDFMVPDGSKYNATLWMNVQPGTAHKSSNLGVTLLAHLVEKVTGLEFRDYCEQEIFSKVGMTNTSYRMSFPGTYDENLLADSYSNTGTIIPTYFEGALYPAGFLRTNILDWSDFMITILNGGIYKGNRILTENSVSEMLDIKFPNAGLAYNSGIGLLWRAYGTDKDWLGHTGGGFVTSSADLNIATKSAVVIFTNGSGKIAVVPDPVGNGTIYDRLHSEVLNF